MRADYLPDMVVMDKTSRCIPVAWIVREQAGRHCLPYGRGMRSTSGCRCLFDALSNSDENYDGSSDWCPFVELCVLVVVLADTTS